MAVNLSPVGEVDKSKLVSILESKIGSFAKPKGIHVVESLPLLGIGKVDRKRLAQAIPNE